MIKNNIGIFAIIASLALVMNACDPETESTNTNLRGSVSIPSAVEIGQTIEVTAEDLSGSGLIAYEWQTSNSANSGFTAVAGETESSITLTESQDITAGRYLRVVVTRDDRDGFLASNTAQIFNEGSVTVTSVTIGIANNITVVEAGESYQLNATVIHSLSDEHPDFFQDVIWEITSSGADSTYVDANNMLFVSRHIENETLSLIAKSFSDPSVESAPLSLNVQLAFSTYIPNRFDYNNAGFIVSGPKLGAEVVQTTTMDGITVYYIENAKTSQGTGTYEPQFIRDATEGIFEDMNDYSGFSFEMAFANVDLLNDIIGFTPRLLASGNANNYKQWERNENFISVKNSWGTDTMEFHRIEFSFDDPPTTFAGDAFTQLNNVRLVLVCDSTTNINGRIYFRNFRFLKN